MAENNHPTNSTSEQASQAIVTMAENQNPYEQAPQPYVAIPSQPPVLYHHNPFPYGPYPPPPVLYHNPFPFPPPGVYYNPFPFPYPPPVVYHDPNLYPPPVVYNNPNPFPRVTENEFITISRAERVSENHHNYTVNFYGRNIPVVVTCSITAARAWVAITRTKIYMHGLRMDRVIAGFGVECSGNNPAATVFQICVVGRCLIFQLERAYVLPNMLREFLNTVKLVGIRNGLDAQRLEQSQHEVKLMGGLLDLSSVATNRYGLRLVNPSYEETVYECLGYGVRLDNAITTSDWNNGPQLSQNQVLQATVDAYVSHEIGLKLQAWRFWL